MPHLELLEASEGESSKSLVAPVTVCTLTQSMQELSTKSTRALFLNRSASPKPSMKKMVYLLVSKIPHEGRTPMRAARQG